MATDGQNNDENGNPPGPKNLPPWLKKKASSAPDDKKNARAAVIQKRLAMMGKKGK